MAYEESVRQLKQACEMSKQPVAYVAGLQSLHWGTDRDEGAECLSRLDTCTEDSNECQRLEVRVLRVRASTHSDT